MGRRRGRLGRWRHYSDRGAVEAQTLDNLLASSGRAADWVRALVADASVFMHKLRDVYADEHEERKRSMDRDRGKGGRRKEQTLREADVRADGSILWGGRESESEKWSQTHMW